MARTSPICCISTQQRKPQRDGVARRGSSKPAACICCVGRHHQPGLPPRTPKTPKTPKTPMSKNMCCTGTGRTPRTPHRRQGLQGQAKMGRSKRWFRLFRRTMSRSPCRSVPVMDGGNNEVKVYNPRHVEAAAAAATPLKAEDGDSSNDEYSLLVKEGFSREDVAAVTIQTYFRAHLARRAFRALKSLVKLQAVARGAYVRRQAEVAIHCMQALVRLQVRVRARQLLTKSKEAQLLQSYYTENPDSKTISKLGSV